MAMADDDWRLVDDGGLLLRRLDLLVEEVRKDRRLETKAGFHGVAGLAVELAERLLPPHVERRAPGRQAEDGSDVAAADGLGAVDHRNSPP